jgi:ABC-2 type transport system permease protein
VNRETRMTWLVARRELRQRGRSRVFAISTVVLMVAVALAVALPAILSRHAKPQRVGIVGGNQATLTKIVEEAGRVSGTKVTVVPEPDVPTAEAGMRSGDLSVVLVNGSEVLIKQVSIGESGSGGALPSALAQLGGLNRLFEQVPGAAAAAANGIALPVRGLEPPSSPLGNRLTGLFTVIIVWVLISVYGSQIAMGIGEEKSSRVVEVLLATLRPVQLLTGKVLGIGLLAFGQAAGMLVAFLVAAYATGSSLTRGAAPGIAVTGAVFVVLGYAFYCTVFAAAGSLVSRQSDVNSVIFPVQLPLIIAYVLSYTVIYANGANAFYHVLGFLPPTAPVAMPVLYAAGDVPVWQVVVSAALCAASTVWMVRVAARIYGGSILRTGDRVRLTQVLRREPETA